MTHTKRHQQMAAHFSEAKPHKTIKVKLPTAGEIAREMAAEAFFGIVVGGLSLFLLWLGLRALAGSPVTIAEIAGWL